MFNQSNIKTAATIAAEQAEKAAIANLAAFKASREALIEVSIVTVNGFQFDAHRDAITNMMGMCSAYSTELGTTPIQWSLADTGTGVMTDITLADLRLALKAAVDYVTSVWGLPE